MSEFQHNFKETLAKISRRGRDTKKPLARHQEVNQDHHAADVAPTELEHEHRKNKGGRGGGWQGHPRKKGSALHASSEGNWRERAPPHMHEEEEKPRKDKVRRSKEEPNWRVGSGQEQWRRPQLQEEEQRKSGRPERRTGPVKRFEPPKNKETQTGGCQSVLSVFRSFFCVLTL